MNIVFDLNPGAYSVSVQCLECGSMVRLCDSVIDADGPAFAAYYHKDCAKKSLGVTDSQIERAFYEAKRKQS